MMEIYTTATFDELFLKLPKKIHLLDKEAKRLGVPRQSIIKVWVAERLEKVS